MEIESAKCECCGLKEDCTEEYINEIKSKFEGKWLCGLCAEAVRDEVIRSSSSSSRNKNKQSSSSCSSSSSILVDDAVKAHKSFCRKFKSNPAVRVADGMRQMLIRRGSGDLSIPPPSSSSSSSRKYTRSTSTSQVGDDPSFSLY